MSAWLVARGNNDPGGNHLMLLRRFRPEDLPELADLLVDTIRRVNCRDYSPEQVRVWAAARDRLAGNPDFFLSLYTIVAAEDGKIVGYGNIDDTGYLDHLYVHSEFQGQGIASSICQELERYAYTMHAPKITVHASITARPFFEKRGYRVLREQQVERQGVLLTNYEMEKTAPGSHLP